MPPSFAKSCSIWILLPLPYCFTSHSAFTNFMKKSVVSQNIANPSMLSLPSRIQYFPVFVYSPEIFHISNFIKPECLFSTSTLQRLPIFFCLSFQFQFQFQSASTSTSLLHAERPRVCYGMEWNWSDFRFLSGRKWVARLRFYINFAPDFYWLTTATYCRISPNDGAATSAISVSGRGTSGSGLVANPVLSEWISARTVDRFSRDCERRVIPVDLDWATTSGRAISVYVGARGHRTPIRQSTC